MLGEEAEELVGVARVGFHRFRRHALFGAEIPKPAGKLGGDVRGNGKLAHSRQSGTGFFTLP